MRRKQKSPAARRTKRVKGLNNKPTENGEPPLGAVSLARVEPNQQKMASHLSKLHLLCVRGNQNDRKRRATSRAASLARVETKTVKSLWNIIEDEAASLARVETKTVKSLWNIIEDEAASLARVETKTT